MRRGSSPARGPRRSSRATRRPAPSRPIRKAASRCAATTKAAQGAQRTGHGGQGAAPTEHFDQGGQGTTPADHFGQGEQRPVNESDPGAAMAPAEGTGQRKVRPPELLAEALQKPVQGALVGKLMTLEEALARSVDRAQQLKIVQAYWRLSTAQADYHWAIDQRGA